MMSTQIQKNNTMMRQKGKKANKYKATTVLGLVTGGFFIVHPFQATFWGGLLDSGFKAAMVGGLADWFAVTALFRRPLGIPWFTEVIPRNREQIFTAIVDMIQNELLTKKNLKSKLKAYNLSQALIDYLDKEGGKEHLFSMVQNTLQDVLLTIRPGTTGTMTQQLLLSQAESLKLSPLLSKMIHWSLENGYADKIFDYLLQELERLVKHPAMLQFIERTLMQARETYEQGNSRRKVMDWLLENFFTGSMDVVAGKLQEQAVVWIQEMRDPQHEARSKAKEWIKNLAVRLEKDAGLQAKIEAWKLQALQKAGVKQFIGRLIKNLHSLLRENHPEVTKWFQRLLEIIDLRLDAFKNSERAQEKFDRLAKKVIVIFIDTYYEHIGQVVMSRLNEFSNAMLVAFIESKVGDDLQMIRINGSLVGGIAGVLFYLLAVYVNL